ncbi:MAG: ScpA family protein [Patescibacteria group bacterium]
MHTEYKVKTSAFEGPMELLLSLIEKRKLFINEISLAQVTDDFMSYLKRLGTLPIGYTANFIITAATLVLIKSRSLLPNLLLTEEEEGDISDLRRRLELYRLFKNAGEKISSTFGKHIMFKRQYRAIMPVFVPDKSLNLANIQQSVIDMLASAPKKEALTETTVQKAISMEEMMENLTLRIKETMRMSFKQFSNHHANPKKDGKIFIIVSFLALLELVKQGIIAVRQENKFGDIDIEGLAEQKI